LTSTPLIVSGPASVYVIETPPSVVVPLNVQVWT